MKGVFLAAAVFGLLTLAAGKGGEQDPAGIFEGLDDVLSRRSGVTVLVFFSPDCYSCFDDLFEMKHFLDKNAWPASVVGIASGLRGDLELFIEKYDWTLPVVWDRKRRIFNRFGVRRAPFKMLLVDGDVIYQDDPYKDFAERREGIKECLRNIFSPRRFS